MRKSFKTVNGYGKTETVERKSRFIAECAPVLTEYAAKIFIEERKTVYKDATHICFAYILSGDAEIYKCYDAGEPSGTAGAPILSAIKKRGLTNIIICVTRYFGGIKLGTGGLSRAYGDSANNLLEHTEICEKFPAAVYSGALDYPQFDELKHALKDSKYEFIEINYGQSVLFSVALEENSPLINRFGLRVVNTVFFL